MRRSGNRIEIAHMKWRLSSNWKISGSIFSTVTFSHCWFKLFSLLLNRKIGFDFVNFLQWFNVTKGYPQGSPLEMLLWLLAADHILKRSIVHKILLQAYAEDFGITFGTNSRVKLENLAGSVLNTFDYLCRDLLLTYSSK